MPLFKRPRKIKFKILLQDPAQIGRAKHLNNEATVFKNVRQFCELLIKELDGSSGFLKNWEKYGPGADRTAMTSFGGGDSPEDVKKALKEIDKEIKEAQKKVELYKTIRFEGKDKMTVRGQELGALKLPTKEVDEIKEKVKKEADLKVAIKDLEKKVKEVTEKKKEIAKKGSDATKKMDAYNEWERPVNSAVNKIKNAIRECDDFIKKTEKKRDGYIKWIALDTTVGKKYGSTMVKFFRELNKVAKVLKKDMVTGYDKIYKFREFLGKEFDDSQKDAVFEDKGQLRKLFWFTYRKMRSGFVRVSKEGLLNCIEEEKKTSRFKRASNELNQRKANYKKKDDV